jgi:hypothetical protein
MVGVVGDVWDGGDVSDGRDGWYELRFHEIAIKQQNSNILLHKPTECLLSMVYEPANIQKEKLS